MSSIPKASGSSSPVIASGNWSTPGLTPDYSWDSPHRADTGFLNLDSYFPVGCFWNCDLHTAEALWGLQELWSHQCRACPSGRWVLSPPAIFHVWSVAMCSPSESRSVGFFPPPWFRFCCRFSEVTAPLWGCILWPLTWDFAVHPAVGECVSCAHPECGLRCVTRMTWGEVAGLGELVLLFFCHHYGKNLSQIASGSKVEQIWACSYWGRATLADLHSCEYEK